MQVEYKKMKGLQRVQQSVPKIHKARRNAKHRQILQLNEANFYSKQSKLGLCFKLSSCCWRSGEICSLYISFLFVFLKNQPLPL